MAEDTAKDRCIPPPRADDVDSKAMFADLLNRIIEIQMIQVELQREHIALARQPELCAKIAQQPEACVKITQQPEQCANIAQRSDQFVKIVQQLDQCAGTICNAKSHETQAPESLDDVVDDKPKTQSTKSLLIPPQMMQMEERSSNATSDAPCLPNEIRSDRAPSLAGVFDLSPKSEAVDIDLMSGVSAVFDMPGLSPRSIDQFQPAPVDLQRDHEDLPDNVPFFVRFYLTCVGLLPVDFFTRWHRRAYRSYVWAVCVSYCVVLTNYAVLFCLRLIFGFGGFPRELVGFIGCASVGLVWWSFGKVLCPKGATLTLIHDMDRHGFDWQSATVSARRYVFVTVCWSMIVVAVEVNKWRSGTTTCQAVVDVVDGTGSSVRLTQLSTRIVCATSALGMLPIHIIMYTTLLGVVWCLQLFCNLHRHELLWYAYALSNLLANDDGTVDAMHALSQAEVLVTWRLRHASETWVRAAVSFIASLGGMSVFLVTRLIATPDMTGSELMSNIAYLLLTIGISSLWGLRLAQVAEVFENDVLRTLNNPLVVKAAQRHFGQQLLAHLHTLEWGFRVGQTVINMKLVMKLFSAVLVTTITALSQSILHQFRREHGELTT